MRLLFRIIGDTSAIKRALSALGPFAKSAGKDAGRALAGGMRSQISAVFGGGRLAGVFGALGGRAVAAGGIAGVATAGAAMIAGSIVSRLTDAIKTAASSGAAISRGARRIGATPEGFQVMQRLADLTGLSVDEIRELADESDAFLVILDDFRVKLGNLGTVSGATAKELEKAQIVIEEFGRAMVVLTSYLIPFLRAGGFQLLAHIFGGPGVGGLARLATAAVNVAMEKAGQVIPAAETAAAAIREEKQRKEAEREAKELQRETNRLLEEAISVMEGRL
jgi:hypothetical protein